MLEETNRVLADGGVARIDVRIERGKIAPDYSTLAHHMGRRPQGARFSSTSAASPSLSLKDAGNDKAVGLAGRIKRWRRKGPSKNAYLEMRRGRTDST